MTRWLVLHPSARRPEDGRIVEAESAAQAALAWAVEEDGQTGTPWLCIDNDIVLRVVPFGGDQRQPSDEVRFRVRGRVVREYEAEQC